MTFQRLTLLVSTASLIFLSFGLIVMFGISIHEKNAEREGYQLALILGRIPLCASLLESEMVVRLRDFIQCETQDCLEDMWVAPSNVTLEAVRRFDKEWSVTARALRATTVFTPHVSFFDSFREQLVTCRTRRTVLASMSAYAELLHLLVQLSHKVQWEPALNTALHHMNSFSHSVARRLLAYTTTLMFSAASSLSVYETERSQSADARVAVQEVTGLIGTFDVMTGVIAPMRESALSILEVPIVESDIQRTLRSLFQLLEETNNRVVNLVSQSVLSNDTLRDFQTTQRLSQYVIEHGTLQHELVQASNSQFENTILLRRFYRGLHIGLLLLGWICSLAGAVLHIYLLIRQRKNEAAYQVLLQDFVIHEARGAVEITETTMNTIKAMTERIKFLDDTDEFLDESLTPRKSEISTAKVSIRSSNLLHSPSHEAEECGLLSSHPSHHTKASKSRSQIELTLWKAVTVLRELRPFAPRGAFLFDTESVTLCSRFGQDPMASSGELYNGSKQVGDGCMELNSADQTSSHRLASVTSNNPEHPNLSFGNPWSETEINSSMSLMRIKKLNLSTRLCARTVTLLLIQRHVESDDEFSDAGPYSELLKQVDTVVNRYGGIVLHMNQDGVTVLFNAMIDTVTSQQSPQQATTDALFSAFVLSQVLGTVDTREEAFSIVLCHGQACVGNLMGHMTTSFQVVGAPVLRALYFGPIVKRHRCPIAADHESSQILKDVGCFVRPIECLSVKCSTIQAAGSSAVTVNSYAGTKSTRTPEPSTHEVVYEILGIPECLYESYTRRSSLAHGLDLALSSGAYLWSPRGPKLRVTCEELLAGLTIWNRAWEMYEKSRENLTDQFEEVLKELIKYRDSYLKGHNGIRGIDVSFDLLYGLILSRLKDLLGDDYELEHTGE